MLTNFHVGTACSSTALNRNEFTPCRNIVSNQFSYSILSTVFFNSTYAIQTLQPHSNAVQKTSPKTSAANTKPRPRLKPTWSSNCFAFCPAQFQCQSMCGMWHQKAQSLQLFAFCNIPVLGNVLNKMATSSPIFLSKKKSRSSLEPFFCYKYPFPCSTQFQACGVVEFLLRHFFLSRNRTAPRNWSNRFQLFSYPS